jgi:hypothetical protein
MAPETARAGPLRGDVPSIRFNGRIRVPTAPLKTKLGMGNAVTG